MLFQRRFHRGIADGSLTLSFRSWAAARVKPGGRYRVGAIGQIEVKEVRRVRVREISQRDARRAGFTGRDELLEYLEQKAGTLRPTHFLYRVAFRFAGREEQPSPSANAQLSPEELEDLARRLDRMDARSPHGAWTRQTLALIARHPRVVSRVLSEKLGRERPAFKLDVRKLKRLGLTISHEVGYELSPRGRAFLAAERSRSPGGLKRRRGSEAARSPSSPCRTRPGRRVRRESARS